MNLLETTCPKIHFSNLSITVADVRETISSDTCETEATLKCQQI